MKKNSRVQWTMLQWPLSEGEKMMKQWQELQKQLSSMMNTWNIIKVSLWFYFHSSIICSWICVHLSNKCTYETEYLDLIFVTPMLFCWFWKVEEKNVHRMIKQPTKSSRYLRTAGVTWWIFFTSHISYWNWNWNWCPFCNHGVVFLADQIYMFESRLN